MLYDEALKIVAPKSHPISITITIDPATKTVTAADYHMAVNVEVNHANVAVIKDKSAVVKISYDLTYPASAEYLKSSKGITQA